MYTAADIRNLRKISITIFCKVFMSGSLSFCGSMIYGSKVIETDHQDEKITV